MTNHSNSQDNVVTVPKQARKYFKANKSVLVVEDDKIMGQMVTAILDDVGFDVVTASSGMMAFEKLQQHTVNFIVLDILLPEMDGFQIYSKLQAQAETKDIPVLIVTAWDDERHRERAAQMGIRHFLPKPFTEDELLYEIFSLLRDHSH